MEIKTAVRPIPESFGDEDMAKLHNALLEPIQVTQDERESQASATTTWSPENMFDIDLGDVDWRKHEPPSALHKAPNVTSLVLLDIITQSIENVKTRVAEEDQAKQLEDEQRRLAEEESRKDGKSPEPYLPIVITAEKRLEPDISPINNTYKGTRISTSPVITVSTSGNVALIPAAKDSGRRRNAFRRFFQRAPEYGEGSAAGGAREALRQKLEARLSRVDIGTTDSETQEALMVLRNFGFVADAVPSKPEPEVECASCLDDIPVKDAVKVPCHSYCRDCFVRLVTAAVQHEAQWPPKCCLNQISFRLIVKNIPDDLKRRFQERSSEWELPISERVYCSQPECGVWIRPKQIKPNKREGRCERGHLICTVCRGPSHGSKDCPQDYEMNLTNILAEQEGWKRCFNCHALVEHKEACQHMTCRCGTEFCYVCGLRWKTCQCTMQQLYALKETADNRREQRRFKDQAEAEELRAVLAQIEEFEREEARRAELDRLEQARLEEERWQRQIKERIRFEKLRREEVKARFRELRILLNDLHQLQYVIVDTRQEDQATSLLQEADSMKTSIAQRHELERQGFHHELSAKVALKDDQFTREYSSRVATECKLEEEYLQQLEGFWRGKPHAADEIERAMFPLRKRMDKGHKMWQKWKDDQMCVYKAKLDDEQMMREELMYSQKKRTKDLYKRKELELARRMVAEKKWFQEIVLERERLLAERELQEVEGDADSLFTRDQEG